MASVMYAAARGWNETVVGLVKGWSCRQPTGVTAHVRSPGVGPIRVDTTHKARGIVLFPTEYYFNYLLQSGTSVQHVLYI